MTDIVQEIREVALVAKMARVMDLMYRAAEEIERLREEVRQLREAFSGGDNIGCAGGVRTLK